MDGDMIYRQAAIDALVKRTHLPWKFLKTLYPMLEVLEQVPSAEPEIVRCKDCKHYNPIGVCIEMNCAVCEDSFCCWAERRTDE